MDRLLPPHVLEAQIQHRDLSTLSYDDLLRSIRDDPMIAPWKPETFCAVDPRTGERVVYSEVRSRRPHDNRPHGETEDVDPVDRPCPVCRGETTTVVDVAPLSRGHTFINKNLYPVVYPFDGVPTDEPGTGDCLTPGGEPVTGLHFLQWTSTFHDVDLHSMPLADVVTVVERLALLEERLLHGADGVMPSTAPYERDEHFGFVGIIKNHGFLVGGSLRHGHQQIAHTNVMPRKILDDRRFLERYGRAFAAIVAERNPAELDVARFGPVRVLVPWFMARPLQMLVLVEGEEVNHLHHLSPASRARLGEGLKAALGAVRRAMPLLGRRPTYNMVVHVGPVGALYVEIHPYTQETGGYEHLGLYVCQGTPGSSAIMLREAMEEVGG